MSLLSFLWCFASQFLVSLHVAGYAQQHAVRWVVAQALHLGCGLGTLEGDDVVAVPACRDVPVTLAPLAQSLGPGTHNALSQHPSLVVEHPHVLRSVSRLTH